MNSNDKHKARKSLIQSSEDIAHVLGSLANRRRLQILIALMEKPQTFIHLQKLTTLGKTALAHHLQLLVKTDIIKHFSRGQYELSLDGRQLLEAIGSTYSNSKRRRQQEATRRADYIQEVHAKRKELKMKDVNVKIVKLEPMYVASVRVISQTPENDAWEKMRAWAEPKHLLEDLEKHPVFGFNNPSPSHDRKDYGYEFWIRVDPDTQPEDDIQIKEFKGGLYAVKTCNLKAEIESEFFRTHGYLESWKILMDWVKQSKYKYGKHQGLEKSLDPTASEDKLVLDLYCPIEKK